MVEHWQLKPETVGSKRNTIRHCVGWPAEKDEEMEPGSKWF